MKRGILFLSMGLLIFATAYAQSLSLSWTGGPISNGQTITVVGDTNATVYSYVDCTNGGADTLSVKVRKREISVVSGSENTFCWGTCYLPNVFVSTYYIDISPDSTSHDFSGDYKALGNLGVTTIQYTFYDMNDISDSVCVFIEYDCSMNSVPEAGKQELRFSNAYPNPAGSHTSFTYSFPDASENEHILIIRDLIGNVAAEYRLTEKEGTIKISTDNLTGGIYFYSLLIEGQPVLTRKLIVKH